MDLAATNCRPYKMAKRKKQKKRKRHSASNFMPVIIPNPTLNKDKIDQLPKIIADCTAGLSNGDINKNFIFLQK
jgi:hypothetical protein